MRSVQYLNLDINKKTQQVITANVGEIGSRYVKIKLIDNDKPLDLTGVSVFLYSVKPDDTKVFNTAEVEDAENGIILAQITSQLMLTPGSIKLTLVLLSGDSKLGSKEFTLNVDDSILKDEVVESTNEFTALTSALTKVQGIDNKFANIDEQFNTIQSEKTDKTTTTNLQQQVNNLVLGAVGDGNNAEVVQARSDFNLLNERFNSIDDKTNCIEHINLVSSNNVVKGKFSNQTIGSSTINSFTTNAEYVTSAIFKAITNEVFYAFVTGYSVVLYYSNDNILRAKKDLVADTMNTITVPSVDGYTITKARIFCQDVGLTKFYISKTKNDKIYSYNDIKIEGLYPNTKIIDEIKNISTASINEFRDKVGFSKKYEKLTNLSTTQGCIISDGSLNNTTDVNHFTIPVVAGDSFIISGNYGWSYIGFVFKDKNNNVITKYPSTTSSSATYKNKLLECNVDGTLYVNNVYGIVASVYKVASLSTEIDRLFQKTIYFDGDSVMAGAGGKSFANQIVDNHSMIYTNKAVGGTTLAMRDGNTNSILERVKVISGSYDFIVIEGGYNDYFLKLPIGALTTNYDSTLDEKTVIGAVESICKHIKSNFDNSNFLFVLGHRASEVGKIDDSFDTYWNAIESALIKWSVNYIDIRKKGGLVAYNQSWLTKYFGTGESMGTHPNELGYKKFYVPYVEKALKEMLGF